MESAFNSSRDLTARTLRKCTFTCGKNVEFKKTPKILYNERLFYQTDGR